MVNLIFQIMNLSLYDKAAFDKYRSKSQIARVLTENWFQEEMYCPSCLNDGLMRNPNNTSVIDFFCKTCDGSFQLKSQSTLLHKRVLDGAFSPMIKAIYKGTNPNFFFMHYSKIDWIIQNLVLIPKFFFSNSIIERRKPLSSNARRSGWVGCNILISRLPSFGKIEIVTNKKIIPKKEVHDAWKKLYFLNKEKAEKRAWTSDVLLCIEKLDKKIFDLNEVYYFEDYLSKLHPDNRHIKAKIRQQLQILRDRGLINFKSKGLYSIK